MAPMGWQEVPPTPKRDDLNGREGGKHYRIDNAGIVCYETGRKTSRNRVKCVACGTKWIATKR